VTQRGNNRQRTFFEDGDYALYLDLLAAAERAQTEVWAYCLMPNPVHIVLVPSDADGLARTFGELHRRHTGYINARRRTDRAFVARASRIGRDGRSAFRDGAALCVAQSGARASCV
jgi:REP element-mobilizing transposase RayT